VFDCGRSSKRASGSSSQRSGDVQYALAGGGGTNYHDVTGHDDVITWKQHQQQHVYNTRRQPHHALMQSSVMQTPLTDRDYATTLQMRQSALAGPNSPLLLRAGNTTSDHYYIRQVNGVNWRDIM